MPSKKIFPKIFFLALFLLFFFPTYSWAILSPEQLVYTPMEEIPGFSKPTSYSEYITAIYKFGLWTVGISAVLMISVGAFMYITSAGNSNSVNKAKGIIVDAIAGIILAMVSYVLLYTINPKLLEIHLPDLIGGGGAINGIGSSGSSGSSGTGKCEPITSGLCSVENLKNTCFGANAEMASAICMAESGGEPGRPSSSDKCQPEGFPVSWGLFQINLSANNLSGSSCSQKTCATSAAAPMYTGKNGNVYCSKGVNYDSCVTAAINEDCNIQTACALSGNGAHWGKWGANSKCGFPK